MTATLKSYPRPQLKMYSTTFTVWRDSGRGPRGGWDAPPGGGEGMEGGGGSRGGGDSGGDLARRAESKEKGGGGGGLRVEGSSEVMTFG